LEEKEEAEEEEEEEEEVEEEKEENFTHCFVWEEYGLWVSENRVLRRIFGPKREEGTDWRKQHNERLHNMCSSPDIT
jgi:hypothetical protein